MAITVKKYTKLLILAVLVSIVIGVFQFTSIDIEQFTPTKIKEFILSFGVIAPLVFIVIYALRAVILVIPVGIMSLAGGLAFGTWFGWVYILIGATIGSCLSFLTARYFGRGFIDSFKWLHKGRIKRFDDKAAKHGFKLILFVRLIPLFQYDAVNFGGGLSKVKFRDFALASLIGMAPGGFINALLGSSLENVISVQFFAALGAFILLMFVPLIYKKIKKAKSANGSEDILDKETSKAYEEL
ncbi:MAG: TVP38/TMEM64 family protein [candidate division Zixibacteria bacterium]|nr:TVP38/TMEM64 family protein [candidate division Zixibacteria bacterium]